MNERVLHLEISKLIGEPISTKLSVPFAIDAIANTDVVEPGEKVWTYTNLDKDADYILDIDANGYITTVKKTPLGDTQLTFKGLNSRLEYVLVDTIIASPDVQVLARKKVAITRGMDKREVKIILDGILAGTNVPANQGVQNRDATSGEDLNRRGLNWAICGKLLKPTSTYNVKKKGINMNGQSAGKTFENGLKLGRLVCAIESEGHITVAWGRRKKMVQLTPRIGVCNIDKGWIEYLRDISYYFGIGVYVWKYGGMYRLGWQGAKRANKILDLIIPYLVIKKRRAELVKQFCESRLSINNNSNPYNGQEIEMFFEVRKLNGKARIPNKELRKVLERIPRDYTPNT